MRLLADRQPGPYNVRRRIRQRQNGIGKLVASSCLLSNTPCWQRKNTGFSGQLLHVESIAIKGVIHIRPRILVVCGMPNAEYPEHRGTGSLTVAAPSPYSVFLSRDR
jgi:hypothetical protein